MSTLIEFDYFSDLLMNCRGFCARDVLDPRERDCVKSEVLHLFLLLIEMGEKN